jgi:hypothetical protein
MKLILTPSNVDVLFKTLALAKKLLGREQPLSPHTRNEIAKIATLEVAVSEQVWAQEEGNE